MYFHTSGLLRKVACKGQPKINVTLTEDQQQLDEVVVVGYGVQKKSHLTGSISKIKNENLGQLPVSRADQALVGKLAGVQIQNISAQSGLVLKFRYVVLDLSLQIRIL